MTVNVEDGRVNVGKHFELICFMPHVLKIRGILVLVPMHACKMLAINFKLLEVAL